MVEISKRVGVIVAQLGTPDEPTPGGLRPYLRQFLSDMRVIDYHPLIWQPILRGIILLTRPGRSARLYQRIWREEDSPLLYYTQEQATGLQARLGDSFRVVVGMTYGNPSMREVMRSLETDGINRFIILPMYPQYSSTTTASAYDAVYTAAAGRRCPLFNERKRFVPSLRFIEPYYRHAGYIEALASRVRRTVAELAYEPERYLFTFHGIPDRYVRTGDPYREHCEQTAQALADVLGLPSERWMISFQSQFGPEPWLKPYTEDVITQSAKEVKSLLVFAPGFVADCLETLDELGNEGIEQWHQGGGDVEHYRLVPCLNDDPDWINVMADLVQHNANGWGQAKSDSLINPSELAQSMA